MFAVDTNVLVYAANSACDEHVVCSELLEEWREGNLPWYITWSIAYEFLRVSTHPRIFTKPWSSKHAWEFIAALIESPSLRVLEHTSLHTEIAKEVLGQPLRGNDVHDAHIAILLREHGIGTIYTRDSRFHRFPFLKVIDPLVKPRK